MTGVRRGCLPKSVHAGGTIGRSPSASETRIKTSSAIVGCGVDDPLNRTCLDAFSVEEDCKGAF
jgi:hypothetical protein